MGGRVHVSYSDLTMLALIEEISYRAYITVEIPGGIVLCGWGTLELAGGGLIIDGWFCVADEACNFSKILITAT